MKPASVIDIHGSFEILHCAEDAEEIELQNEYLLSLSKCSTRPNLKPITAAHTVMFSNL